MRTAIEHSIRRRLLTCLRLGPCIALAFAVGQARAQAPAPQFKVIAFYTAKHDQAHISFVNQANAWFPQQADRHHFSYEATADWRNLNAQFLSQYQVVLFLDTRPEDPAQRAAFQQYMERGGAWIGFHFAAFALEQSAVPMDWDWYHKQFLGSGAYASNTWKPSSAVLRVEAGAHPATEAVPARFASAPNEWYRWSADLRANPDIKILLAIDGASFPLGTGPKPSEIWHDGYYPVAWTNTKYKMVYINMGHNDIDYRQGAKADLSSSFSSAAQNRFLINALLWLGRAEK